LTHVANLTTDIIVVAIVLGFLIFIHEAGHFLAAKHFGVRAPVFSIGFGKRLWGFKRGGTDYRISLLPVGGYVRMEGEDPSDPHPDDPGAFLSHPRWQRFWIAFAGPAVNILAAVVLLAVLYKVHYQRPAYEEQPARIGFVAPDSPAAKAGLKAGDMIVRMGSIERPDWSKLEMNVLTTANRPIPLEVRRGNKLLTLSLTPTAKGGFEAGYAGLYPCLPTVVGEVTAGSPASHAGLKPGDRIVSVEGEAISCFGQISTIIQTRDGKPVLLGIARDGENLDFNIQPVRYQAGGQNRWIVGVQVRTDVVVRQLPAGEAFVSSVKKNLSWAVLNYVVLKKILTRQMSSKALAGPVGIAQMSGEAYRMGFSDLILFVAYISLDLAIVNLLPIPILDGGMILLLAIEGIMQRDLSVQFKEKVIQAAMFLILLIFVIVTYNDIIRAVTK
jgi:regulator of sigma E protease